MPAMLSVYHNSIEHANRFCSVVYMIPQNRPKMQIYFAFFFCEFHAIFAKKVHFSACLVYIIPHFRGKCKFILRFLGILREIR